MEEQRAYVCARKRACVHADLDGIVGAAGQQLGDLGPSVAEELVRLEDRLILIGSPCLLANRRVEMVVPALAALPRRERGRGNNSIGVAREEWTA